MGSDPGKHAAEELSRRFSSEKRLKKRPEILKIQDKGKKLHSRGFLIAVLPSVKSWSRLAVTVSTAVDKRATVRNQIKRRLREIFRLNMHRLTYPLDIVIIARKNAKDCSFDDMERQILGAFYHAKYLKD